jgi:transglutaminase-like putative cysteine protease
MKDFLQETNFFDYSNDMIQDFINEFEFTDDKKQNAILLYNSIRDKYIYDPYNLDLTEKGLKASQMVLKNRAWCVEKATLLIACCRAIGIPARPGYAIVKNHIGVERLTDVLKSDLIVFHGYADIFIEDKWVKATPAFDYKVCRISGVSPLEFDGENDSLFQEFQRNEKFMEYMHDYGTFIDVPAELMNAEMKKHYPHLFTTETKGKRFSFKPMASFLHQRS